LDWDKVIARIHHHQRTNLPPTTGTQYYMIEQKRAKLRKQSCLSIWRDPKKVFKPDPNPKNSPLSPKKAKNDPKIQSNLKGRFEGIIENESCSTIWVDPKIIYELKSTPEMAQNSSKLPQKLKDQKTEKSYKMKVI